MAVGSGDETFCLGGTAAAGTFGMLLVGALRGGDEHELDMSGC